MPQKLLDFVVSDELTSLTLTQLPERPELNQVFTDHFKRAGCIGWVEPATLNGAPSANYYAANYYTDIVTTASAHGHTAIGYHNTITGDVIINPPKRAANTRAADDEIIIS